MWTYPIALAAISVAVAVAERLRPWRPQQGFRRPGLLSDFAHLIFNGHFLGMMLYGIAALHLLPTLDAWLRSNGLHDAVYRGIAADWPVWVQIVVAVVAVDLLQWGVHVLLHRVSWLWHFHKTHHSVVDGQMDWIASFRFQWTEVVVYRTLLYLPLAWLGFGHVAVMTHAIFGTLIGHLNHANLDLGHGPWRYILNSPRMHLWHHDRAADGQSTVNFGIIFSAWDWIFRTAKMPAHPPERIGFDGDEAFPQDFLGQMAWPAGAWLSQPVARVVGALILAGGWWLAHTPLAASSPPPAAAMARPALGAAAIRAGYAHPEDMVSVEELAPRLGDPDLAILDVRPRARFAQGHLPGAQSVERADFTVSDAVPGLSAPAESLERMLRARGVDHGDTIIVYGDGGPEPYRLWWTLQTYAGVAARVLDGGLIAWKAAGLEVVPGAPARVAPGDVTAQPSPGAPLWRDLSGLAARARVVDSRSAEEYTGARVHPDAARGGHVPGALSLPWTEVLRGPADPRLRPRRDLEVTFAALGLQPAQTVLNMCQTGTRSAAVHFALRQAGFDDVHNYDGSWAEYSRLTDDVATGACPDGADAC